MSGLSWRVAVALLVWSSAYNMTVPFLPLAAMDRGATASDAGIVQGVAYAGAALALLPLGWLADRAGRKRTLMAAWGVGAVGMAALVVPGNWKLMLPGGFLALAGAGGTPALAAMISEAAPAEGRRTAITTLMAAAPAGLLLGSALGGIVGEAWGLDTVFATAVAMTVAALAMLMPLPADRALQASPGHGGEKRWRALLLFGVPAGVGFMLLSLPSGFMTPYLRDVVGLSLRSTGVTNAQLAIGQLFWSAVFAVWPRTNPLVTLRLGSFALDMGRGTLLAIGVCLGANAAFGFLFPTGGLLVVVAALILRGALFSLQPLGMTLVSEVTGTGQGLATRFGVMALIIGGAAAGAPVIAGVLYQHAPGLPFLVSGAAAALGAGIVMFVRFAAK